MSHTTRDRYVQSSFILSNMNDDFYNAELKFASIWCTSPKYDQWCISFQFANPVRDLTAIHVKLVSGMSVATQEPNPDGRNYTRVFLIPHMRLYTTNVAVVELAQLAVNQGTKVCDIMRIMHNHIPYYELTENDVGFSAWVLDHVKNFLNVGVLVDTESGVLSSIQNQIVAYNRSLGYIRSQESQWPFIKGTVHLGPP